MNIVISGAGGFFGRELSKTLAKGGNRIFELNRYNQEGLFKNCNLANQNDVKKIAAIFTQIQPHTVYHLAAKTSIKNSWSSPFDFISYNLLLSENLLQAIQLSKQEPLLIILSSSAVYDDSNQPIAEDYRLAPNSPYAVSKLVTENLARRYPKNIIVRPFFSLGFNKKNDVVIEWVNKLLKIEEYQQKILEVQDLTLERDYVDISEVSRLLSQIAEKGQINEVYNLCSGTVTSLHQVCDALALKLNYSLTKITKFTENREEIIRKKVIGDTSKLNSIGIFPNFNLQESVNSIIDQTYTVI
jgi:nucleoside-diphosphate-sugar epimerase